MSAGLESAAGASCNSFFGLAAFLLLGDTVPELTWMADCPVDAENRRTDRGRASNHQWLLCGSGSAGRLGADEHWLLLPPGVDLATYSVSGFKAGTGRAAGYFARALDAGYRFRFSGDADKGKRDLSGYQDVTFFDGWMPDLPNAEARVFAYPQMLSPRSLFGSAAGDSTRAMRMQILKG